MTPLQIFQPGNRIKFPLSTSFKNSFFSTSGDPPDLGEASNGAGKLAVTMTDPNGRTAACMFEFVPYTPGAINYVEGKDTVVSGIFTGCYMAVYTVKGIRRVAHVHTGTDAPCQKKTYSALFTRSGYTEVGNFKPYDGNRDFDIVRPIVKPPSFEAPVLGLITPHNRGYSIYLKEGGSFDYTVHDCVERTLVKGIS